MDVTKNKKGLIYTFVGGFIVVILFTIVFLSCIQPVSPLAKWINVGLYCQETQTPVPNGLAVRLTGQGYDQIQYTEEGQVLFGSGLIDGKYTVSYYWNAPFEHVVDINCSEITWNFDFGVPNPTITKHFRYDAKYFDCPPVVGLNVTLNENGVPKTWQLTDGTGTVTFDGQHVNVCDEYDLSWLWGSEPYSEGPIHFGYVDGELLVCTWEETNYLLAKSGGDLIRLNR